MHTTEKSTSDRGHCLWLCFFFLEIASVIICLWLRLWVTWYNLEKIVTVRMPLSRSIIPWVRVSIGLRSVHRTGLLTGSWCFYILGEANSRSSTAVAHAICASVCHDIRWRDKYIPFVERTAPLHCWGTLGVENTTSKNIKPTILVDGLQNTWQKQQRNIFNAYFLLILTVSILWNVVDWKCRR